MYKINRKVFVKQSIWENSEVL